MKQLTKEVAEKHLATIRAFSEKLIGQCSQIDPSSGRRIISMQDRRFEVMHQKEKDKFYLDTGYTVEHISKFMKQQHEKENPHAVDSQSRLEFIKNKILTEKELPTEDAKKEEPKKGKTVTLE